MENRAHALTAGAFVLALLALLIGLALWLTRDGTTRRVLEVTSAQPVTGLQPQASVRFKGVNVGKVTGISLDPEQPDQVLIRIAVDPQTPITSATYATLGFQGVTGLAFVQLDNTAGATPGTAPPARIPMRAGWMATLRDQGENLLRQLDATSQHLNQLLAPGNQRQLMEALGSLGQAASSLNRLTTQAADTLPALSQQASGVLHTLATTSEQVGDSADEARLSARAFRLVTERMSAPGGTLDQLREGADTLHATGQVLNTLTLPRLNRAVDDAAHTARQVSHAADTLSNNPQSLLLGNAPLPPGPGEAGFTASSRPP
jgi:phospholipid/cholesterol/gamma-HCH transport system substrate-binding protein